jgi:dsDNA-binding SOS-regulon protein
MEWQMFTSKQYRAKSSEYGELIKASIDPSQIRKYQNSKDSFNSLADNEEWLADNFDKMLQVSDEVSDEVADEVADDVADEKPASRASLAAEEERVLRCLGAAVIMQWNTVPAKLQRELFDTAGSMGELLDTAELRGQIARFLHKHKDDDSGAK